MLSSLRKEKRHENSGQRLPSDSAFLRQLDRETVCSRIYPRHRSPCMVHAYRCCGVPACKGRTFGRFGRNNRLKILHRSHRQNIPLADRRDKNKTKPSPDTERTLRSLYSSVRAETRHSLPISVNRESREILPHAEMISRWSVYILRFLCKA